MHNIFILVFLLFAFFTETSFAQKKTEDVAPPGSLQFHAESNLYRAIGTFESWEFTKLKLPSTAPDNLEGLKATVEIDMGSVTERTIRLSQDLKTREYFDVKKHPKSSLKVKAVRKISENKYQAEAELKLKKTKQKLVFDFEVLEKSPLKIAGEVILLRQDFSVGTGNQMESIQNEVKVLFETLLVE